MPPPSAPLFGTPSLAEIDGSRLPVTTRATDYPAGSSTGDHQHPHHHQLIHAVHGVMVVLAQGGRKGAM